MKKQNEAYQIVEESLLKRRVLSICLPEYDGSSMFHGMFYEKRKKLYTTGKSVAVKEKDVSTGVAAFYQGKLTLHSVQWQKTENGKTLIQTLRRKGQDIVTTRDADGMLRKKEIYEKGGWQRTEYYSPVDAVHPQVKLEPDFNSNGIFISTFTGEENQYDWKLLQPVEYDPATVRQSMEDSIIGTPHLLVAMVGAEYAYCEEKEYQARKDLENLNEEELQRMVSLRAQKKEPEAEEDDISDIDRFFEQYEKTFGTPVPDILPGELPFSEPTVVELPAEEPTKEIPAEEPVEVAPEEAPAEESAVEELPAEEPAEEIPAEEPVEAAPEEAPTEEPAVEELSAEEPTEEIPAEEPAEVAPEEAPAEQPMRTDSPLYMEKEDFLPAIAAVRLPEKQEIQPTALPVETTEGTLAFATADGRSYGYIGQVCDGKRSGRGRTEQPGGKTAYEGEYRDDQRDGFGSVYYRSGALSFVGYWQENKRSGLGVSVQEDTGTLRVQDWQKDVPAESGFVFRKNGEAEIFAGEGTGLQVSLPEGGILLQNGSGFVTLYDANGILQYAGQMKDGLCEGTGTCFAPDGKPVFTGEWKQGKAIRGYLFPQPEETEA